MAENNITNKRTPLRNSNSANKPFRSPLTAVSTPKSSESPRNVIRQSPMQKNATPKRLTSQCRQPLKRRRIEDVLQESSSKDNNEAPAHYDIVVAQRRIDRKRLEHDNLKRTLHYIRKHNREELLAGINKWRNACKEALFELHRSIRDKSSENVTMRQVLAMLGIAEETVNFTEGECDLS